MSRQFWTETLAWAVADGTAVANTTTEALIYPGVDVPANYMQDGRALRLTAFGKLSTTGTPTITFTIRWGGLSGTVLAISEAITCATGSANVAWSVSAIIQTRTNGSSGALLVMGHVAVNLTASTLTTSVFGVSGFDAPAPVTVDLTAAAALALTADWSAASASNTLTGMMFGLESLN